MSKPMEEFREKMITNALYVAREHCTCWQCYFHNDNFGSYCNLLHGYYPIDFGCNSWKPIEQPSTDEIT